MKSDPFEVLRIDPSFDVDLGAVEKRVRDLSRVLHPDRNAAASPGQRRMSLGQAIDVNEAWRVVRDPIRRAEALLARAGVRFDEKSTPHADPGFLIDFMEQREALSEAMRADDRAAVDRIAADVRANSDRAIAKLSAGFAAAGGDRTRIAALGALLGELRYYRRLLDEVGAIEDDRAEATAT